MKYTIEEAPKYDGWWLQVEVEGEADKTIGLLFGSREEAETVVATLNAAIHAGLV